MAPRTGENLFAEFVDYQVGVDEQSQEAQSGKRTLPYQHSALEVSEVQELGKELLEN